MSDPRFDWGNLDVVRYNEQQSEEVRRHRASLASIGDLLLTLEKWWLGSGADMLSQGSPSVESSSATLLGLSSALRSSSSDKLYPVIAAIPSVFSGRVEDIAGRLARQLLAESLGRATAARTANATDLHAASDFAHGTLHDWSGFHRGFLDAIDVFGERRAGWTNQLKSAPDDVARYIRVAADERGMLEWLREEEVEFRREPAFDKALHASAGHLRVDDGIRIQFAFLLDLDPCEWVRALDRVPSAIVAGEIVDLARLWNDRSRILLAISHAEQVFDSNGYTGKRALFSCVDEIVHHGEQLDRAVSHAARLGTAFSERATAELEPVRSELRDWFAQAFQALLRRPDGERAAIEYAAILALRTQAVDRGSGPWSAPMAALESLIVQLESRALGWSRIREVMAAAPRESQLRFLLIAAGVGLAPTEAEPWAMKDENAREQYWEWYCSLLKASDEGIIGQVNPYTSVGWPLTVLGAILAGWPDSAEKWRQSWEALFSHREKARFDFRPNQLDPSVHLVRVGVGALGLYLGRAELTRGCDPRGRALWGALFKALQYLVYGQRGRLLQFGPIDLARLFAYLPGVFGSNWREQLNQCWPAVEADEKLWLRAMRNLLRNGISWSELDEFCRERGLDMTDAGTRAMFLSRVAPDPDSESFAEACLEVTGKSGQTHL